MDEREMVEFVDGAAALTSGEYDTPIGHVIEDVYLIRAGMTSAEVEVANAELARRGSSVIAVSGVTSFTVT